MSFWQNGIVAGTMLLIISTASAQTRPNAISGDPSSATHCVSGNSANVHGLGWVDAGTNYTVTFETGIPIHTAVGRVALAERSNSTSYGTPDIARNAATAGTMALFVGGGGQTGCYRYKVAISAGAAATAPSDVRTPGVVVQAVPVASARTISGAASSATHCTTTAAAANVHDLGRVEQGNRISLTFAANFDAVAGAHIVNVPTQQSVGYTDDNSGGGTDPALTITAPHTGSLALHVGGVGGAFGCYRYKVEIR